MQRGDTDSEFEFKGNLFLFALFGSLALAVYLFYPEQPELPPSPMLQQMISTVHDVAANTNTVLDKESCHMLGKNARHYSCRIVSYSEQEVLQYLNNSNWQYLANQSSTNGSDAYYFWNGKFKLYLEKGTHQFLGITDKK